MVLVGYLILAIGLLLVGHLFRVFRWSLLLNPFVSAQRRVYFVSLALGYFLNFLVPFKLGELGRALVFKRLTRMPLSYVLFSIVYDRIFDIWAILILQCVLVWLGVFPLSVLHVVVSVLGVVMLVLLCGSSTYFKRGVWYISSVFNETIRRHILTFFWSGSVLTRTLVSEISLLRLVGYSVLMWGAYVGSLFAFVKALNISPYLSGVFNLFEGLYLAEELAKSGAHIVAVLDRLNPFFEMHYWLYFSVALMPLLVCSLYILVSMAWKRNPVKVLLSGSDVLFSGSDESKRVIHIANNNDFLAFLDRFFLNDSVEGVLSSYTHNQDVLVLKDLSGGSDATTVLAQKDGDVFVRKYATGNGSEKLHVQFEWLTDHAEQLPVSKVISSSNKVDFFSYDMAIEPGTLSLFEYAHQYGVDKAKLVLEGVLKTVTDSLHSKKVTRDSGASDYIKDKWTAPMSNVKEWAQSEALWDEPLLVNQTECPSAKSLFRQLNSEVCDGILKMLESVDVHGDLTFENIIVDASDAHYLIDPNPQDLFSPALLDIAKLYQSLRLGYEFIGRLHGVTLEHNRVEFQDQRSGVYETLKDHLDNWLTTTYGKESESAVRLLEVIHYARLLPYKIKRKDPLTAVYFSCLILLMKECVECLESD